jgi:hypothetical protein
MAIDRIGNFRDFSGGHQLFRFRSPRRKHMLLIAPYFHGTLRAKPSGRNAIESESLDCGECSSGSSPG